MLMDEGRDPAADTVAAATEPKSARLRVDEVVWREVGEDLVVLELATSTYLTLNGSAKLLWTGLADGATTPELAASLTTAYGITTEQADADTAAFLSSLVERRLLQTDG
jgi:hypothetical protein